MLSCKACRTIFKSLAFFVLLSPLQALVLFSLSPSLLRGQSPNRCSIYIIRGHRLSANTLIVYQQRTIAILNAVATKHRNNEVRLVFLFACLTGLRISDIHSLEWSDIKNVDGMYFVVKEQKKTHFWVSSLSVMTCSASPRCYDFACYASQGRHPYKAVRV